MSEQFECKQELPPLEVDPESGVAPYWMTRCKERELQLCKALTELADIKSADNDTACELAMANAYIEQLEKLNPDARRTIISQG